MNNTILILTHKYPYEPPTEQFFHQELQFIVQEFEKIIIIPTSRYINKNHSFDNNSKVIVANITHKLMFFDVFRGILFGAVFNISFWREIRAIYKNKNFDKLGLIKEITKSYVRSSFIFFSIMKSIRKIITMDENVLIYSYWLNNDAIVGAKLKIHLTRKGFKNVKILSRAHGQGDLYVNYRPQLKYISDNLDEIVSISRNGAQFLEKSGFNQKKISVSRLGVSKQFIPNSTPTQFIIASCSMINDNKRVEKIARALSLIHNKTIKWVHFGEGELKQLLTRYIQNTIPSNVECVLRGNVPNQEIIEYYLKYRPSIFINVSTIEGIPVSIMEAMSCGIPVIATDVGATNEIVNDGENGLLLNKDFCDKNLADLIERFHDDPVLVNKMGLAAYNKWHNDYDSNKNYMEFVNKCITLLVNKRK